MTPDRWQILQNLFHEAQGKTGAERDAFLDSACRHDATLRRELDEVLAIADGPQIDFDEHVQQAAAGVLEERDGQYDVVRGSNGRVGPYRILSPIGKGGMGAVYLAQREEEYEQKVALKVVDSSLVRSPDVLARFRFERQVLAHLDHPHIARLLDGGVTVQRIPYLVMEYVDGIAIDVYCKQNQLSTRQRIDLFRLVCQAVAHAHQNLVVHRDIKPGNILVTAARVPKLLDFGIAKALESDHATLTRTRERLLTPGYASPEQIRGGVVTTATDVYSLGALLFELLTGKRLFEDKNKTPFELEVSICEEEPPRPGSLAAVDADLDAIVLKAIRKEPNRRYISATALDEDLRRYLDGYPVEARRGGWRYSAGKYVRRHRTAIAAGILVVAALGWGGISTRRAQARAERRFGEVRELANQFLFDFNDAIADLPGATKARAMVVQRAIVYLDRLAAESSDDPVLQTELAKGYDRLRDIRYTDGSPNIGESEKAVASGMKAIGLWEAASAALPRDSQLRAHLADSHLKLGNLIYSTRTLEDSRLHIERAVAIYEELYKESPQDKDVVAGLSNVYFDRGVFHRSLGNAPEARRWMEKCIALRKESLKAEHSAIHLVAMSNSYMGLGDIDRQLTLDWAKAEASYRQALGFAEEAVRVDPKGEHQLHSVATAHQRFAILYSVSGRPKEALPHCEATMSKLQELRQKDRTNIVYIRGLRSAVDIMGSAHERMGDVAGAIPLYRQGIAYGEELANLDASNLEAKADMAISVHLLGTALAKTADQDGARKALERAAALREPLAQIQPDRVDLQERLAVNYLALGLWYAKQTDCSNAQAFFGKSSSIFDRLKNEQIITTYGTRQYDRLKQSTCPPGK